MKISNEEKELVMLKSKGKKYIVPQSVMHNNTVLDDYLKLTDNGKLKLNVLKLAKENRLIKVNKLIGNVKKNTVLMISDQLTMGGFKGLIKSFNKYLKE